MPLFSRLLSETSTSANEWFALHCLALPCLASPNATQQPNDGDHYDAKDTLRPDKLERESNSNSKTGRRKAKPKESALLLIRSLCSRKQPSAGFGQLAGWTGSKWSIMNVNLDASNSSAALREVVGSLISYSSFQSDSSETNKQTNRHTNKRTQTFAREELTSLLSCFLRQRVQKADELKSAPGASSSSYSP